MKRLTAVAMLALCAGMAGAQQGESLVGERCYVGRTTGIIVCGFGDGRIRYQARTLAELIALQAAFPPAAQEKRPCPSGQYPIEVLDDNGGVARTFCGTKNSACDNGHSCRVRAQEKPAPTKKERTCREVSDRMATVEWCSDGYLPPRWKQVKELEAKVAALETQNIQQQALIEALKEVHISQYVEVMKLVNDLFRDKHIAEKQIAALEKDRDDMKHRVAELEKAIPFHNTVFVCSYDEKKQRWVPCETRVLHTNEKP